MKTETGSYSSPALGCMLGSANQILLSELAKALRKAKLQLTTTEYLVLRALYSKEGIQQCDIAEIVGRDKAGICRCVAALVKKGLVRTETISYKCQMVYLTEKAFSIRQRIMEVADSRHQALINLVCPEDLEVLRHVLETIIKTK